MKTLTKSEEKGLAISWGHRKNQLERLYEYHNLDYLRWYETEMHIEAYNINWIHLQIVSTVFEVPDA